jgi:two-component system phosphate regulon sensor histidine kinase PhoR
VIVLLVTVQLYWLYKIYAYEQKEFSTNVVKSIRGLYEDFNFYAGKNLQRSIEMPDKNTFLFKVDKVLQQSTLADSLSSELEQSNVFTDCNIALYDPVNSQYLYQVYVPSAASSYPTNKGVNIPLIKRDYSYVYLFFPHRNK